MTNAAAAFLSYAHINDEQDGGKVTAFGKALQGEVRVQTGRSDFRIFQDRDGVAWGQAWQERINQSLDAATFLIPVLTPSFFASEQCRQELRRFLDREENLARDDLVLPVYWIATPLLDEPALRASDELARELTRRQYADWRELRFRRLARSDVRQALAALATRVRDALDGVVGAPAPGGGSPTELVAFLGRVSDAYREQHRGASVTRSVSPGGVHYLDVRAEADGEWRHWPVGICPGDLDSAALEQFVEQVHAEHVRRNKWDESHLVYGGAPADPSLERSAGLRGVKARPILEVERGWDHRRYVARQAEKLKDDRVYPPGLYIPQRYVLLDEHPDTPPRDDVFTEVIDLLGTEDPRLLLILADFGHGKTFLARELARRVPTRLPRLAPMLIELHSLEKRHGLDGVLALHLQKAGEYGVSVKALRRMLERGRLLLIFDGFDELAQRLTFDAAAEYLRMILSAVSGQAKIVVTSRTQHFASDKQWSTQLREQVHLLAASRLIRLVDFDDNQIRRFLVRIFEHQAERDGETASETLAGTSEAEKRADDRLALLGSLTDLIGLSRNPRMLSFVADLPDRDLPRTKDADRRISSSDLYRALVDRWLRFEVDRRHPTRDVEPSFSVGQLHEAVTELAIKLWTSTVYSMDLGELEATVRAILPGLGPTNLDSAQATFVVGAGSLLTRDDEDRFSFVHASVQEYLVAVAATRQIKTGGGADVLGLRVMSELVIDFLCGSMVSADRPIMETWVRDVLTRPIDPAAGSPALAVSIVTSASQHDHDRIVRENALAIARQIGMRVVGTDLAGKDLRGRDLSDVNLRYADLTGADLTGARLTDADLTGANLTGADLAGARLVRPRLTGVRLAGSRWHDAALLAPTLDDTTLAASELLPAAITGRDAAEPMLLPPRAGAWDVKLSADGTLLAAAYGSHVMLINAADLRAIRVLTDHVDSMRTLAFSPDGRLLATGDGRGDSGRRVRLWEVSSGRMVAELTGDTGPVSTLVFSRDSHLLATGDGRGDSGGRVRLWEVSSGRMVAELTGHTGPVNTLAFSPDGRLLATGDGDSRSAGWVRLWDPASGRMVAEFTGHTGPVTTLAFSPDGRSLAFGDLGWNSDGRVWLWEPSAGRQPVELPGHNDPVTTLAFSPDGMLLAFGDSGGDAAGPVWLRELASGRKRTEPINHRGALTALAFSPDSHILATGDGETSADGRVRLWDLDSGRQDGELTGHTGPVTTLAFSPDGRLLATGDNGRKSAGRVRLWDPASGRMVAEFTGHTGTVTTLAFSPDGRLLATGDNGRKFAGGRVRLWDIASGRQGGVLTGHTGPVTALAFSPDGRLLATGDKGRKSAGRVRLWDPATERMVAELTGHTGPISTLAFSPDNHLLATGDGGGNPGGRVRLWEFSSGRMVAELTGHTGPVTTLAFSPDGRLLATDDTSRPSGGQVRLWDLASDRQRTELIGHTGPVTALAFSPDGHLLTTGDGNGVMRIWDATTFLLIATAIGLDNGWAVLLPDGSYKLVGDPNGHLWWTMKLCRFEPGELDGLAPSVRCLDPSEPLPGLERYRSSTTAT
jgi:WD40 repeat protein